MYNLFKQSEQYIKMNKNVQKNINGNSKMIVIDINFPNTY